VEAFPTHVIANRRVAGSMQNQALGVLLFIYRQVIREDLSSLDAVMSPAAGVRSARLALGFSIGR
jgi:hypothetical protein